MIANRLAGTYTLLGEGEKVMDLGRWALDTGRLDAAADSQTRTLIAIGASQVSGPRQALVELATSNPIRRESSRSTSTAFPFAGFFDSWRATWRRPSPICRPA